MPSTPTTKSQVQAHQFVLRRMQSALVRRDAVMLNDPMRTHSRATIVGLVLGVLGMLGFVIFGLISPQPTVPESGNIVIGEQSGTVYVVAGGNPKKLIPTFNLASARLLLMTQQSQAGGQQGGTAAPAGNGAVKDATVVADAQLANIPRGRLTGIPDGPQLLPSDQQRISNNWAVCDEIKLNPALPDPTSINKRETTVLAGVPNLGTELAVGEALLATNDNGKTYLIYRLTSSANQPNADAVRAEVDLSTNVVKSALGLNVNKSRKISNELLNAIPEVPRLTSPRIDGEGTQPAFPMGGGLVVGDVFSTSPTGGSKEFWVVTRTGIQHISPAVADIIRTTTTGSKASIQELGLDKIQNVKKLALGDAGYLPVGDYPQQVPVVLDPAKQSPVACLGWNLTSAGDAPHTAVFVGSVVPKTTEAITVGTPSPDGSKIDKFYLQPGFAAVVQSATVKETFGKGNLQLVSDRGLRYGVPDSTTANGLGLNNPQPAPDSILRLLPTGASLNVQDVLKTFDSVPIDPNAGAFPSSQVQAAPAPGN